MASRAVFTMTGEAGRLFIPLAITKTFAMVASIIVALAIIPPVAHLLFGSIPVWLRRRRTLCGLLLIVAALVSFTLTIPLGIALLVVGIGVFVGIFVMAKKRKAAAA